MASDPIKIGAGSIELTVGGVLDSETHVDSTLRLGVVAEGRAVDLKHHAGAVWLEGSVAGVHDRIGRTKSVESGHGEPDLRAPIIRGVDSEVVQFVTRTAV